MTGQQKAASGREQPLTPPEWQAWERGEGRCPICEGIAWEDFAAICDCWRYEREEADHA